MTFPDLGPVHSPTGRPLDQIQLIGLTARGHHGVLDHERVDGQDFTIDLILHLDTSLAGASDDLADTVDYGALAVQVADVVRGTAVNLIERLAAKIADQVLGLPGVLAVDVAVHKPHAPIVEQFADVVVAIRRERVGALDLRPVEPVTAVLALGTNLGDREGILQAAVAELDEVEGVRVDAVSPVVETDPVGGPDQPDYLNAVVLLTTSLAPDALLAACQRIEAGHGRERSIHWGPRTLDVDMIRYGDLLSEDPRLELPHPRAEQRAFVLAPWLAIDPEAWLPSLAGRRPVAPLLPHTADRSGLRNRPDLRLTR
jgi:dihydroneopterin aldolase/2-amino-4-hydroxy-6-hydroxymethyldihydropteridine diphosphokinase